MHVTTVKANDFELYIVLGFCRLDKECSPGKFWNYLRRQLYVMDTYINSHNERLNHAMLALHCYLSWAFIAPAAISSLQVAAYIYQCIFLGPHTASRPPVPCLAFFAAFLGAHVALLWMTGTITSFSFTLCRSCLYLHATSLHCALLPIPRCQV